ncbi:hypothetical protein DE146DRAFT_662673, partial [Phaeosphaeria sp. MPI-PUGE-AT-0046c]
MALSKLRQADQERLYATYSECARWQRSQVPVCEVSLATLFHRYPKLRTIRIDGLDEPGYLGGWLQDRGHMLGHDLDRSFTNLTKSENATSLFRPNIIDIEQVITALAMAQTSIEDLRMSGLTWDDLLNLNSPQCNLHTLRITIKPEDVRHFLRHFTHASSFLTSALRVSPKLEDLSVTKLQLGLEFEAWPTLEAFRESLLTQSNLRRVCLLGSWDLEEHELVSFVNDHAHSLTCLVLDGPHLLGRWNTALEAVGRATRGKLTLMRGYNAEEDEPTAPANTYACYSFAALDTDFAEKMDAQMWQNWLDERRV